MLLSPLKISPFVASIIRTNPINTVYPIITGSAAVGNVLTVTHGTYTGDEPIIISGNWQRDGVDIVGETADTYTLVNDDIGAVIRYRELATDVNLLTTTIFTNTISMFGVGYMIIGTDFIIS